MKCIRNWFNPYTIFTPSELLQATAFAKGVIQAWQLEDSNPCRIHESDAWFGVNGTMDVHVMWDEESLPFDKCRYMAWVYRVTNGVVDTTKEQLLDIN